MSTGRQRLAVFLPDLSGGGAERITLDLVTGFLESGLDVDIVLATARGALMEHVPENARVVDLGAGRIARALLPLRRYLRTERPAGVIAGITHTNVLAILASRGLRPRVPVVVVEHNTLSLAVRHARHRIDRAAPYLIRAIYPLADRVVAVSAGVADDLAATAHLAAEGIDVIYNPMVIDRLLAAGAGPAPHPWLRDETISVVLGVGRLRRQKDFATLIRAMTLLPPTHRLLILGEGEEQERLSALISQLELGERVHLLGYVGNPYPYFRHADVFVLSSRWEGLPTVLIEAMAFPIALVSTDCPSGPAEILENGRWGTLVPVGDEEAIARAVLAAPRPAPVRPEEALAPYDLRRVSQQYLDVICGAATRRSSSREDVT